MHQKAAIGLGHRDVESNCPHLDAAEQTCWAVKLPVFPIMVVLVQFHLVRAIQEKNKSNLDVKEECTKAYFALWKLNC